MKPFLKWAGGKYALRERIQAELPHAARLIEPFVGSGAMFLNTNYSSYLLADSNADLMHCYQWLMREGDRFIRYCQVLFTPFTNTEDAYYTLRTEFNAKIDERRDAALFLYLNRHGYNGLCRYNANGGYNVPFGRYQAPYFPYKEMQDFYARGQHATIQHADFIATMDEAGRGDVVYCDPPYVPLTSTANFTSYQGTGFALCHQELLARKARELARRGVTVVVSNHDTLLTRRLYAGSHMVTFDVQRTISCNGAQRGKAPELLAVYPAQHNYVSYFTHGV